MTSLLCLRHTASVLRQQCLVGPFCNVFSSRWSTFHLLSILFVKVEMIRHDGDFENKSDLLFDDIFLLFYNRE